VTDRQPRLSPQLVDPATQVVNQLAESMPHQQAAVTVHAAALDQHARQIGLGGLADVTRLHPGLADLADIDTTHPAITALWAQHQLMPDDLTVQWWTYPLGDLYQTLSTESRKGRALCQTPWWVADLLLHTSYDRAIEIWDRPKVIDPSCGTGHLLLETWMRTLRGRPRLADVMVESADQVHGVDLDPYAVLVARYRMLVLAWAALRHTHDTTVLRELPLNIAAADSLLDDHPLLERGRYEVVVANPPYIVPPTADIAHAVRARYPEVCHRQFSLALPFHALMMRLLVDGGWCAQLTANSFIKREFGTRYVEQWLPRFDAQWVIDTSGAYIPGHGTPTVILVHRNQPPEGDTVRVVQGIRGEPSTPEDPSRGLVWTAIRDAVHNREAVPVDQKEAFEEWVYGDDTAEQPAGVTPLAGHPNNVTFERPEHFGEAVSA